jgi:hypothetical protein
MMEAESRGSPTPTPPEVDQAKEYIDFGDFARNELGMQCQYAAYFIHGLAGYPQLCGDLRLYNPIPGGYHTIKIHKDDAPELKKRVEVLRENYYGITIFPGYCRSCEYRNRHYEPTFSFPVYCTKKNKHINHADIFVMKVSSGCDCYELQTKPGEPVEPGISSGSPSGAEPLDNNEKKKDG